MRYRDLKIPVPYSYSFFFGETNDFLTTAYLILNRYNRRYYIFSVFNTK